MEQAQAHHLIGIRCGVDTVFWKLTVEQTDSEDDRACLGIGLCLCKGQYLPVLARGTDTV
eukprot:2110514-Rhodomonas_salina.1